ncbi:thiopeptide-type bacteriocin biosynthesis protein [Alteribacter populi]|uniref:thiopeptide-type bacteriocin biosynthesis protein n=1 Tax=Alteribacter populi TaxID=2011011 RepID=UPI000BBB6081|nr:thiopeptide-type bacteriocin biosynthesis protein [Alteribacter populi]
MWTSKHIFIHDYELIDDYLKEILLPLAEKELTNEYFFIRYWDGGPHVRLRYKNNEDNIHFERQLHSLLDQFKERHLDWVFKSIVDDERVRKTEGEGTGVTYPNFSIQSINYFPEFERYGGESVMNISEEIFVISSKFASNIIRNIPRNKRYAIGYDLMFECGKLAEEMGLIDNRSDFFYEYNLIWKNFHNQPEHKELASFLYQRAKSMEVKGPLKPYKPYLTLLKEKISNIVQNQSAYKKKDVYFILISHIHMLNNRLGVSPDREYIFSKILCDYHRGKKLHAYQKEEG